MTVFNFKHGTKFTRGGQNFISGGQTRYPIDHEKRIVLIFNPDRTPAGWLFLEDMQKELAEGFIQLQIDAEYIQDIANNYYYYKKKEELVRNIYWSLKVQGLSPAIVNDKYLEIGGRYFQFIRRRQPNGWGHYFEVKEY